MRLILVRHGITEHNKKGCFLGDIDSPLSPNQTLSGMVKKVLSYKPDLIISSPKKRALSTAQLISDMISVEEDIKELSFGEWEGLTPKEVSLNDKYFTDLKRWQSRNATANTRPTGGESLAELENRVENVLNNLYKKFSDKTVVIVTHVYVIKAILDMGYNVPTGWHSNRLWLTNGAITMLDWHPNDEKRLVHCVNCVYE